jgi:nucleotide-binding universal stress UspA family protein
VRSSVTTGDIGAALLAMAAEVHADLLVMGGYGRALPRTPAGRRDGNRAAQMTVPVLMAH